MLSTLLFVSLIKGLKLVAYLILVVIHEWPRLAPALRQRCVRLGYWWSACLTCKVDPMSRTVFPRI